MKKVARDKKGRTGAPVSRKRAGRVPPPGSELWPVWCRGKLWTREAARWFAGRCQLCAYACRPPESRRRMNKLAALPTFLVCTNHPASPGRMREVMPTETCRNFVAQRWRLPRVKSPKRMPHPQACEPGGKVRHIPLGHGLFATVDAAKARDRMAYKLHGPFAYLNFPEDFPQRRKRSSKKSRGRKV